MSYVMATDQIRLRYDDAGAGRAVVLVHGWPMDGTMWSGQADALISSGLRVITYDRRGFGHSGFTERNFDFDRFADDLSDVIETLDLHDICLVGYSMGGGDVARYLSRHGGSRISAAILVSALVPRLSKSVDLPGGVDPAVFEAMASALMTNLDAFLTAFPDHLYRSLDGSTPALDPALVDWTLAMAESADPRALLACVELNRLADFEPDLAAFTMPTLIIHGGGDGSIPAVVGRMAAKRIVGSSYCEYADEPHGLFVTAAARLAGDIAAFFSQTERAL